MVIVYLFSLTFTLFLTAAGWSVLKATYNFKVNKKELTFREAENSCKNAGGVILGGSHIEDNELQTVLLHFNWQDAWTKLNIQRFGILTWVNGFNLDDRRFDQFDAKCGVLHIPDKALYEHPCNQPNNYLCELKNCHNYQKKSDDQTCISINGTYYTARNSGAGWFDARNQCQAEGGDLAVIRNNVRVDELAEIVWRNFRISSVWVGLRTIDWFMKGNDIERYSWLDDQPNVHYGCVVLKHSGDKFGWETSPCNRKAKFVCHQKENSSPYISIANDYTTLLAAIPDIENNDKYNYAKTENNKGLYEYLHGGAYLSPLSLAVLLTGVLVLIIATILYSWAERKEKVSAKYSSVSQQQHESPTNTQDENM